MQGDHTGCVEIMEAAVSQLEYPPPFFVELLADCAALAGDFEKSRKSYERRYPELTAAEPAIDRDNYDEVVSLAYVLQKLGEEDRANTLLVDALAFLEPHHRLGAGGYGIRDAEILALMGQQEQSLAALREAIDAGWRSSWSNDNWSFDEDPFLASIQDRPDFQDLVAEVKADIARMRDRAMQAEATGNWEALLAAAEQEMR